MGPTRRQFVSTLVGSGVASTVGCLRLTEQSEQSSSPGSTDGTPESPTGRSTGSVRLEREWTASDLSGDALISNVAVWRDGSSVIVGRYDADSPDYLRYLSNDGTELWRGADVPESHTVYRSSLAVDGDTIVAGFPRESNRTFQPDNANDDGALVHCYDGRSGDLLWKTTTPPESYFLSSIGIADDGMVTAATDARSSNGVDIYGLDISTGEQRWRQPELPVEDTVTRITDSITNGSRLFVSSFWGIFALDVTSGDVVEQYRRSGAPYFGLTVEDEHLYGTDSSTVNKFDISENSSRWETDLVGNGSGGRHCELGDDSVFVDDGDGYVYSFDKRTGAENWRLRVDGQTNGLALTPQHVWISDTTGVVRGYTRESGEAVSDPRTVTTKSSAAGEQVPLVGLDGSVFIAGTESGRYEPVPV